MVFIRQSLLIFLIALFFLCTLQIDLIRVAFEEVNNNNIKIAKQSLELTQTLNLQRQEYLQKQCETLGYNMFDLNDLTKEQMDHMIVDKEHKLLYCYVPKVGDGFCIFFLIKLKGRKRRPDRYLFIIYLRSAKVKLM